MGSRIAVDRALIDHAFRVSGETTRRAAVTLALEEFVARREQRALLELVGSVEWDDSYDVKAERTRG